MNLRAAKALGGASTLAIVFGIGYLIDCRRSPTAERSECWMTGGAIAGLGGTYKAGYWTPNPALEGARRRRRIEQTEKLE